MDGVQFCGDIPSVHWNVFSTVGGYNQYCCGDTFSAVNNVQYYGVTPLVLWKVLSAAGIIISTAELILTVLMVSLTVLMVSPYTVLNILRGTKHLPQCYAEVAMGDT